uniref:Uncharacterized protein n=1 Tax=Oryza brachyantha TaxID=4533 RepID=J3N9B7_ORYBR
MAPPCKKVLMLCGDYMEDYEAAVPFYALAALGVSVDCVAPGKVPGDACLTAVHDFLGHELYTELPGSGGIKVSGFAPAPGPPVRRCPAASDCLAPADFTAANPWCYDALVVPGGSMRHVVELAGGRWVEPEQFGLCFADRHVLSATGWPAHGENIIRELISCAPWRRASTARPSSSSAPYMRLYMSLSLATVNTYPTIHARCRRRRLTPVMLNAGLRGERAVRGAGRRGLPRRGGVPDEAQGRAVRHGDPRRGGAEHDGRREARPQLRGDHGLGRRRRRPVRLRRRAGRPRAGAAGDA